MWNLVILHEHDIKGIVRWDVIGPEEYSLDTEGHKKNTTVQDQHITVLSCSAISRCPLNTVEFTKTL